ncbi:MAG: hypothetical protein J5J00_03910 [Deltaproteobacteria bacterium]|nr:hypothetical protein [Deltaproteobacteria bacterium]
MITSKDHMTFGEALRRLEDDRRPTTRDLSSESNSRSMHWDLNTGFGEAVSLAKWGWPEKREDIQRYFGEVQRLVDQQVRMRLDVAGEAVDVGAFLEGEPECMLSYQAPEMRSLKVIVNLSARFDSDARTLLNRGIAVASLVYALQSSGVGVSLAVGEWVHDGRRSIHETIVEVNQYSEYIDPGRLAFWIAHPAALRRCIFRYQEQRSPEVRERFGFQEGGGYGKPVDPDTSRFKEEGTVFIPYPDPNALELYETPEKAFDTVRKIAAKQGVHLGTRHL